MQKGAILVSETKRIRITEPTRFTEEIKTVDGILTGKQWLEKEKKRIEEANSKREPTIEPCGKKKNQYALFANEPQKKEEKTEW